MIVISNSALHTPKKWPGFMERAVQRASNAEGTFKKIDGTPIAPITLGDSSGKSLLINRGKLHEVLYEYALELGIPIEFNAPGKEFFETEDHGGVVLTDGRRLTADIVVAADGIGSKSWTMFAGTNTAPVSSGFVLYRITFPVAPALKNPIIAKELEGYKERGFFYAGPDAHFMTCMTGDDICWMLTCKVHITCPKPVCCWVQH
jgi:2-polyprenyl-6-methoxyphenol hydroxylase-like FAD-dependent oxidoreductase